MYRLMILFYFLIFTNTTKKYDSGTWIRINQLGYTTKGIKVAVWCSKEQVAIGSRLQAGWQVVEVLSKKAVFNGRIGRSFGEYGPFKQTYRFNFSAYKKPGRY